jgi:NAD(P)H dehydrogenase (quinone)
MTTAVIGATGRVGRLVVRGLLEDKQPVIAIVRDAARARQAFGPEGYLDTGRLDTGRLDTGRLDIREVSLDRQAEVRAALDGAATVFIAMGSAGLEGNLQRVVIQAAATAPIEQFVRLSVLNTSATSFGINQRAHWNIDFAAQVAGLPYSTIRPAIFSASLLAGAAEVRASRTWTGLAGTGRIALIDHRDAAEAAVRVITDPGTWGTHHDLTGPRLLSWPEAMQLLSAELGEPVTFVTATEPALLARLTGAGVPPFQAELLIAREWAVLAGENERTTTGIQDLTGHPPRTVEDFLHENREAFR